MTVSQWLNILLTLIQTMAVSIARGFDPVVVERETARLEAAYTRQFPHLGRLPP
jgi:hypothetical protein